ncbi:MAG: hypothetical protein ACE14W_03875 [Candidatus Velamenicoccus archaeovorus]
MGLLGLAVTGAVQAAWAQTDPRIGGPAARIAFVGPAGDPLTGPVIRVTGAYPGMGPERSVLAVRNVGGVSVTYRVSTRVSGSHARALARVLEVRVTEPVSDRLVYHGGLADLRFAGGAALVPGELASYRISVAWPASQDDRRYDGVGVAFELRGTASAVLEGAL